MFRPTWFTGLLLLLTAASSAFSTGDTVSYKVVKYDGLAAEVAKHRGKVVVVDIWAEW